MSGPDVSAAIAAVRAGEPSRYEEVIVTYQQILWAVVARYGLDRETVRDVVQQAFIEAYLALDRFDPQREFGAWLCGIACNLVRKELRARSCHHRHEEIYRQHLEHRLQETEQAAPEEDPLLRNLRRCRERLDAGVREVLDGFYERSESIDAIAVRLGRSAVAVKQLLWRTRVALRRCIEEQA